MGWNINKLAEVGAKEKGGSFVCNHLVKVDKATDVSRDVSKTDVSKEKTYNMVKLLLTNVIGPGKLVALDSGFPTLCLLRDAKDNWNTSIIATKLEIQLTFLPNILCLNQGVRTSVVVSLRPFTTKI